MTGEKQGNIVLTVFYEQKGLPNKIFRECHEHITQKQADLIIGMHNDRKKRGEYTSLTIGIGTY